MAVFTTSVPVNMLELPEIAALVGGELMGDFLNDYLLLGHVGDVSYLLSGDVEAGNITGLAVIKPDGIAYQFREMTLPPEFQPQTLMEVLDVVLAGRDKVFGSKGDDHLVGMDGPDRLEGGRGDDILNGGYGADKLKGGPGDDTFVLDYLPDSGRRADSILDFRPGHDLIGLSASAFTGLGSDVSGKEFHVGKEAEHHSDRLIYNDETGALFFDADGRGKIDPVKIAILDPDLKLHPHDFIVLS
jgi:hypothetical protein